MTALGQLEEMRKARFKPDAKHKDVDAAVRVFVLLDHSYWDMAGGLWLPVPKSAAHDLLRKCSETKPRAAWEGKDLYLWPSEENDSDD